MLAEEATSTLILRPLWFSSSSCVPLSQLQQAVSSRMRFELRQNRIRECGKENRRRLRADEFCVRG